MIQIARGIFREGINSNQKYKLKTLLNLDRPPIIKFNGYVGDLVKREREKQRKNKPAALPLYPRMG